jgi:glycosyltransferase involved in cell wall biosynthesis
LEASRIHIIPNGYDGAIETFEVPKGERCTVLYAGTLSSYRYDTLLTALHDLKQSDPARARQLRVLFVGEETDVLQAAAARQGLSDVIECAGPVSNEAIGRLQSQAHALLVLGRPQTMKGYELFAGAKLFGYLKAGRPIMGVLPLDETRKVLSRVGVSTIADSNAPSEIAAVFRRLLDAWSEGTLAAFVPNRAACEAYSAESQTASLVRALEARSAADPFVPNLVGIPPSLRDDINAMAWADAARAS